MRSERKTAKNRLTGFVCFCCSYIFIILFALFYFYSYYRRCYNFTNLAQKSLPAAFLVSKLIYFLYNAKSTPVNSGFVTTVFSKIALFYTICVTLSIKTFRVTQVGEFEFYRNQLWTAPELLRIATRPINGTQKADVYSFAIVLQEIMFRAEPYFLAVDLPQCMGCKSFIAHRHFHRVTCGLLGVACGCYATKHLLHQHCRSARQNNYLKRKPVITVIHY